jgi:hypothetical protein
MSRSEGTAKAGNQFFSPARDAIDHYPSPVELIRDFRPLRSTGQWLKPEGGYGGSQYRRVVALRNASYTPG